MARTRQECKIQIPPRINGFVPKGNNLSTLDDAVVLNLDEYEAMRLLDYEDMKQEEASEIMGVSRPTLTRIYERARKKIAKALTEARELLIEGGNTTFVGNWYCCQNCRCSFNSSNEDVEYKCPLCKNINISKIENK